MFLILYVPVCAVHNFFYKMSDFRIKESYLEHMIREDYIKEDAEALARLNTSMEEASQHVDALVAEDEPKATLEDVMDALMHALNMIAALVRHFKLE